MKKSTVNAPAIGFTQLAGMMLVKPDVHADGVCRTFERQHTEKQFSVAYLATGIPGIAVSLTVGALVEGKPGIEAILLRDRVGATLGTDGKPLGPGCVVRSKGFEDVVWKDRFAPLKRNAAPSEPGAYPAAQESAVARLRSLWAMVCRRLTGAGYSRVWTTTDAKGVRHVDAAATLAAATRRAEYRAANAETMDSVAEFMGWGRRTAAASATRRAETTPAGWEAPAPKAAKAKARK